VAVRGHDLGILVRQYHYRDGNDFPYYAMVHVDLDLGEAGAIVPATSVDTYSGMIAGGIEARDEGFVATVWRAPTLTRFSTEVRVGAATWTHDGMLAAEHPDLGALAELLGPCACNHRGTAFSLGAGSVAAIVRGDTLWLLPVEHGDPFRGMEPLAFARFAAAPPRTTPISGASFSDGRIAIAGGGYGPSLDPRDAFLVVGARGAPPVMVELPGERYDPPPLVTVRNDRLFTFRFASEPSDLDRSRIVAEERGSADAGVIASLQLPTRNGLVPVATAAYRGASGAGLAWVEPDGAVQLLPAPGATSGETHWTECSSLDAPAVASLPAGVSHEAVPNGGAPMFAVGTGDGLDPAVGDVVLAILDPTRVITIMAIPACRVVATPPP
jgi:hypothetical protein